MGTRRSEELISAIRQQAYSEDYSLTEGWSNDVIVTHMNLALNSLYHAITQIDNDAHVKQYAQDIVSGQMEYDIPMDVFMAIRLVDVRYLWGTQEYEFVELKQGMIQDRLNYPINIPDTYAIRDGKILLSPTPNLSKVDSLIVNYQKRMRSLDIRRGQLLSFSQTPVQFNLTFTAEYEGVSIGTGVDTYTGNLPNAPITAGTITLTDGTLTVTDDGVGGFIGNIGAGTNTIDYASGAYDVTFSGATSDVTASFSGANSAKNANMQEYADSMLDKVDYICLVDVEGTPLVTKIPVSIYDSTSKLINAHSYYSIPVDQLADLQAAIDAGDPIYVVSGEYASTHSELDLQCESYLIEYCISRLLRLQSNTSEMDESKDREQRALSDLVNAYRRIRKTIYPVRWTQNFSRSSYPFGRRGIY